MLPQEGCIDAEVPVCPEEWGDAPALQVIPPSGSLEGLHNALEHLLKDAFHPFAVNTRIG